MQKMNRGTSLTGLLLVFEKAIYEIIASGQNQVLINFDKTRFRHSRKTNFITFQILDPEIFPSLVFYKRVCD